MGAVERVLVLGIVVVIVAILGIAVWGAAGDNSGKVVVAQDGGAVVTGQEPPAVSAPPLAQSDGEPSPISGIDAWRKLHEDERNARSATADGAAAATDAVAMTSPAEGVSASNLLPGAGGPPLVLRNFPPALEKNVTVAPIGGPASSTPVIDKAPARDSAKDSKAKDTKAKDSSAADSLSTGTYTVVKGDSLWKIAHRAYGDADIQGHIDAITAANPKVDPDNLKVGQKLTLPGKVTTDKSRLPAKDQVVQKGDGTLYEVTAGDTLSSIARKQLGDSAKWKQIYELNRERIADPARISVGTSLRLPPKN